MAQIRCLCGSFCIVIPLAVSANLLKNLYILGDKGMELLNHLDELHTTELGIVRIKRNLSLNTDERDSYYERLLEP